ncbi:MAG: (Fe-S)-binding protein [Armatimonadetes bacterium]|nr:(Fe-S)-binding protein [Armatimonadota bacterium]
MQIALFVPCHVDQFMPQVAEAAYRLLRSLGHNVVVPEAQTCCGQPAYNAGYWPESRRIARNFLRVFGEHGTIVAPSGSCVSMVRTNYPGLFAGEPEEAAARALGHRVHELSSFLVDILQVTNLGAELPVTVTVHDSCHALRELGVRDQPRALLAQVRGLTLVEMAHSEVCCGFGGLFSVKYPELSTAMADEKLDNALATGAQYLVGVEASCLLHLQGRLRRRALPLQTLHLAELLAWGKGLL